MSKSSRRVVFDFTKGEVITRERWEQLKAQGAMIPDWILFESMSSAAATPARETATPAASTNGNTRTWDPSSSALLTHFARALWSGRTRTPPAPTLFGLGGECGLSWSEWDTVCCPSDSAPVALGLTTVGTACSCSASVPTPTASLFGCKDVPRMLQRRERIKAEGRNGNGFGLTLQQWVALRHYPTPTATDWKGSTGKGSRRGTLAERAAVDNDVSGETVYPHPRFVEALMGFPIGWSELAPSETPLMSGSPSGSADA